MRAIPLLVVWLMACDPSPRSGGGMGQPSASGPYVAGTTCSQIIECMGGCTDPACQDACNARGAPEAQAGVRAIQQCAAQAQCADGSCLGARCSAELAACANSSSVASSAGAPGAAGSPGPVAAAAGGGEQCSVAPGPAASDDQFMFRRSDGLEMASTIAVVARGRAVAMNGVWKDSLRGLTIEISGSSYKLTYEASFTTADSMGRPSGGGGVANVETGSWRLDGPGTIVLSPAAVQGGAVNANDRYAERTTAAVDAPRRWAIEGLMLNYQRMDDNSVHPVEGIAIAGPAPRWAYSPDGTWSFTLRRAR